MNNPMKHLQLLLLCMIFPALLQARDKAGVIAIIEKVNDYWQKENPLPGNAFWHQAAYHTGNMAAYQVTGREEYRRYS